MYICPIRWEWTAAALMRLMLPAPGLCLTRDGSSAGCNIVSALMADRLRVAAGGAHCTCGGGAGPGDGDPGAAAGAAAAQPVRPVRPVQCGYGLTGWHMSIPWQIGETGVDDAAIPE